MSLHYIRRYYGVPAFRGARVRWVDRDGTITSGSLYIRVRFDGERRSVSIHPKDDDLVYLTHGREDAKGEG